MSGRFAVAYHLIYVIGDAVDFPGRIFDGLGRTICGLRRFVGRDLRLICGLFGMLGGLLSLGGGGFSLLGLLFVARRTSDESDREDEHRQRGEKSAHLQ
jgi:hypothetical protein